MKKAAGFYAVTISVIGILVGIYSMFLYFSSWSSMTLESDIPNLIAFLILYVVLLSLPLKVNEEIAIDMSFICMFAAVLVIGPWGSASLALLSTPLVFETDRKNNGQYLFHFMNTAPIKLLFNTGNRVISIVLGGLGFTALGGIAGEISLPGILLPSAVFIIIMVLVNCGILIYLFKLDGQAPFFASLTSSILGFLPSIAAAASLGFFLAFVIKMEAGQYLVLLFMMPLMLARYAFKLYVDVKNNYYKLIQTLTVAMEAKDSYTEGHSRRVGYYAEKLGNYMKLPSGKLQVIRDAALLHDIGKIGIDDAILCKPAKLTPEERTIIETHPVVGVNIIKDNNFSEDVKKAIRHHHERYDGKGYPDRTKADEINIEAYILGVADAFDAITTNRVYRQARSVETALKIIEEESGKQFHPQIAEAFIKMMNDPKYNAGPEE